MATIYIFPIVLFFLSVVNSQGLQTVNGRIKVTIGTTSGSGDTVRFIPNLVEAYNLYKDYLDIEFIPWGRTVRNDDGSLQCQFGVNDCWANRLHRCTLNILEGNPNAQMDFMNCEFTAPYPAFVVGSYICAHNVGVNLVDVDNCVNNSNDELDAEAERRGTEVTQALNSVPSIVFNDNIDQNLHTQALSRLVSTICSALAADPTTGIALTNCTV